MQMMIQYHDEPYALWRQHWSKGQYDQARVRVLLSRISDWNLFLLFLVIDAVTAGKEQNPIRWFLREVRPHTAATVGDEQVELLAKKEA